MELRDITWRPLNEILGGQTVAGFTLNVSNAEPAKSFSMGITLNGMARFTANAMLVAQQQLTILQPLVPLVPRVLRPPLVVDGQPWGHLLWAPLHCLMDIHLRVVTLLHHARQHQAKAAFDLVRASLLVVPDAFPSAELPGS